AYFSNYMWSLQTNLLNVVDLFQLMSGPANHVTPVARDNRGYSLLASFFAVGCTHRLTHDYNRGLLRASGIETQISSAPRDDEPYVCVHEIVSSKSLDDSIQQLLFREWSIDLFDSESFEQSIDLFA